MPVKTHSIRIGGNAEQRSYVRSQTPPDWIAAGNNWAVRTNSVTTGANLLDWKDRIRLCQSATTGLSGVRYRYEGKDIQWVRTVSTRTFAGYNPQNDSIYESRGQLNGVEHPTAPTLSLSFANNAALMKFVKRAIAEQQSMQGCVFIGEIREALHMIRSPFKSLRKGLGDHFSAVEQRARRMRKGGKLKTLRETKRMVADSYLEVMFGLRPLLSDIDSGMKALAELSRSVPFAKRLNAAGEDKRMLNPVKQESSMAGQKFVRYTYQQDEAHVRYTGALSVRAPSVQEQFGLKMADMVPALWELIPWSFVADYFTNLGEIITACSFNTSDLRWVEKGTKSSRANVSVLTFHGPIPEQFNVKWIVDSAGRNAETKSIYELVERQNYTGLSLVPSLEFQIPGMSMKWLNLAALGASHRSSSNRVYRPFRR